MMNSLIRTISSALIPGQSGRSPGQTGVVALEDNSSVPTEYNNESVSRLVRLPDPIAAQVFAPAIETGQSYAVNGLYTDDLSSLKRTLAKNAGDIGFSASLTSVCTPLQSIMLELETETQLSLHQTPGKSPIVNPYNLNYFFGNPFDFLNTWDHILIKIGSREIVNLSRGTSHIIAFVHHRTRVANMYGAKSQIENLVRQGLDKTPVAPFGYNPEMRAHLQLADNVKTTNFFHIPFCDFIPELDAPFQFFIVGSCLSFEFSMSSKAEGGWTQYAATELYDSSSAKLVSDTFVEEMPPENDSTIIPATPAAHQSTTFRGKKRTRNDDDNSSMISAPPALPLAAPSGGRKKRKRNSKSPAVQPRISDTSSEFSNDFAINLTATADEIATLHKIEHTIKGVQIGYARTPYGSSVISSLYDPFIAGHDRLSWNSARLTIIKNETLPWPGVGKNYTLKIHEQDINPLPPLIDLSLTVHTTGRIAQRYFVLPVVEIQLKSNNKTDPKKFTNNGSLEIPLPGIITYESFQVNSQTMDLSARPFPTNPTLKEFLAYTNYRNQENFAPYRDTTVPDRVKELYHASQHICTPFDPHTKMVSEMEYANMYRLWEQVRKAPVCEINIRSMKHPFDVQPTSEGQLTLNLKLLPNIWSKDKTDSSNFHHPSIFVDKDIEYNMGQSLKLYVLRHDYINISYGIYENTTRVTNLQDTLPVNVYVFSLLFYYLTTF